MKRINYLFTGLTMLLLLGSVAFSQSTYTQFGNINNNTVTATTTWTKLNTTNGTHTFVKNSSDTTIEVFVNSRFGVGAFTGANGVRFQVRIDSSTPNFDNLGSILVANTSDFLAIFAVFQKVPAGKHTVSIWAQTATGSAAGVLADPGGWGGKIIVKETM